MPSRGNVRFWRKADIRPGGGKARGRSVGAQSGPVAQRSSDTGAPIRRGPCSHDVVGHPRKRFTHPDTVKGDS